MMGCSSPDEVLADAARRAARRLRHPRRGRRGPSTSRDLPGRHALAGEEPRPALTHTIVKATGEERWAVTKATPVRDEHGAVVLAVNIIEDVTDARLAERQQRFLSAASMLVSSSLDIDVTLDKVAGAAVPELADWCCVDVPDERGVVRRAALGLGRRPTATRWSACAMRCRWTPTTPARPRTCCAPGSRRPDRRLRRGRRARLGRRRRGAGGRAARQSARARRWSSR